MGLWALPILQGACRHIISSKLRLFLAGLFPSGACPGGITFALAGDGPAPPVLVYWLCWVRAHP